MNAITEGQRLTMQHIKRHTESISRASEGIGAIAAAMLAAERETDVEDYLTRHGATQGSLLMAIGELAVWIDELSERLENTGELLNDEELNPIAESAG